MRVGFPHIQRGANLRPEQFAGSSVDGAARNLLRLINKNTENLTAWIDLG
jgi:hypothetical protein